MCFDLASHKSMVLKAEHKLMEPFNTPIKIPDSQTFNMFLGVLGLALQSSNNKERLYFGTLSKELYSIPIKFLDFSLNETLLNSTEIKNHGKRLVRR